MAAAKIPLPNGAEVFGLNRGETLFVYDEIFGGGYLRHGITVRDGDTVVDVGANIGLFLVYLHLSNPAVRLLAFEPVPEVCDVLRQNVALFGMNADVEECALGASEGTCRFTYYPDITIMSGCYADAAEDASTMKEFILHDSPRLRSSRAVDLMVASKLRPRELTCARRTLSSVIAERNVERIDLLKIDVEKSELDVLLGIRDEHWPRIRQVVVEVQDRDGRAGAVTNLLRRHGMRVSAESGGGGPGTGLTMLFARRDD